MPVQNGFNGNNIRRIRYNHEKFLNIQKMRGFNQEHTIECKWPHFTLPLIRGWLPVSFSDRKTSSDRRTDLYIKLWHKHDADADFIVRPGITKIFPLRTSDVSGLNLTFDFGYKLNNIKRFVENDMS